MFIHLSAKHCYESEAGSRNQLEGASKILVYGLNTSSHVILVYCPGLCWNVLFDSSSEKAFHRGTRELNAPSPVDCKLSSWSTWGPCDPCTYQRVSYNSKPLFQSHNKRDITCLPLGYGKRSNFNS